MANACSAREAAESSTKTSARSPITAKLMVDGRTNRVIFAEARRDLVDILFGFLTMRFSSAVRFLGGYDGASSVGAAMPGSLSPLYSSAASLDSKYIREPPKKPTSLLTKKKVPRAPSAAGAFGSSPRVLQQGEEVEAERERRALQAASETMCVYYCEDCRDDGDLLEAWLSPGQHCKECNDPVTGEFTLLEDERGAGRYVRDLRYIVTDELRVAPSSAFSCIEMLRRAGLGTLADVEEKVVEVGEQEKVALFRASLMSTTALTDVFLKNKTDAIVVDRPDERKEEIDRDGVVGRKRKLALKL